MGECVMDIETAWEYLIDHTIATEEELQLATNGWGYNLGTLETVLYARTGHAEFPANCDMELE
jgi:hypothetical protein